MTSDLRVPAFYCEIDDRRGRPPFLGRFGGLGCHPCVSIALTRALTEAAQSRLTFIVGSREDLLPERYETIGWRSNLSSLLAPDWAAPHEPARHAPFAVSFDSDAIDDDVSAVLRRLIECEVGPAVMVDLTRPAIEIPCVRMIVPGLEGVRESSTLPPGRRARGVRSWLRRSCSSARACGASIDRAHPASNSARRPAVPTSLARSTRAPRSSV